MDADLPATLSTEFPASCLNCSEPVRWCQDGRRARFCVACGQETNVQAPRLMEFAQHFGGAYLSTEGALWRTLKLLLTHPGELTRQYIAGRRKHYVLPLRLYLTISVVALVVGQLLGGGHVELKPEEAEAIAAENRANFSARLFGGKLGMRDKVFFCEGLPQWLCRRAQQRIDVDPKAMAAQLTQVQDRFIANLRAAMFFMVPSFAAGLALVYRNRRLRYTEHLVFALHTHAFWFIALAVSVAPLSFIAGLAPLTVPVYGLLAMKRVYGGRWPALLLRAFGVSLLYSFALSLAMAGLGAWALLA